MFLSSLSIVYDASYCYLINVVVDIRKILKETYRNKVNEEIARNSVDSLSGDDLGMSTTPGTGNPVFRMGLRQQLESDIARKSSFNDNFVDAGVPGGPRV